jgi:phenylpropionate dioxygenase-like ring-hydroxylating dioxygenase large terminal subunit
MKVSLLPQYWYIVGESFEFTKDEILSRQILDEWLACYRDERGQITIVQDRCIHRCARLSCGSIKQGKLTCGYHGWVYGLNGHVESIPSEKRHEAVSKRELQAKTYPVLEQDGYIYVCLSPSSKTPSKPHFLSSQSADFRGHVRLRNRFGNSLANCVENYIDVPHTAYVHHGIFRKPRAQELRTTVIRKDGEIHITYHGETLNLGSFSWFLNPQGKEILHSDHFYPPNVTSVHYQLPNGYRYSITSHSVPLSDMETLVYTDIHYDFGFWSPFVKWLVRRQAQTVINQDIEILDQQGRNIEKYGALFYPTSADVIHTLTSEIIDSLKKGNDPSELATEEREITFFV